MAAWGRLIDDMAAHLDVQAGTDGLHDGVMQVFCDTAGNHVRHGIRIPDDWPGQSPFVFHHTG